MLPEEFERGELLISKNNDRWEIDYYEFMTYDNGNSVLPHYLCNLKGTMADATALILK